MPISPFGLGGINGFGSLNGSLLERRNDGLVMPHHLEPNEDSTQNLMERALQRFRPPDLRKRAADSSRLLHFRLSARLRFGEA